MHHRTTWFSVGIVAALAACSGNSDSTPRFIPRDRDADDAGTERERPGRSPASSNDDDANDDAEPDALTDDDDANDDDANDDDANDDDANDDDANDDDANDDRTDDDGADDDGADDVGTDDDGADDVGTDDDGASGGATSADDDAAPSMGGSSASCGECESSEVCCGSGPCAGDCVPDCRLGMCPEGMSCAGDGVCVTDAIEPEPLPQPVVEPEPDTVECGTDICLADEVCCESGPCAGMCVMDCREGPACPDDLTCNASNGVCEPPASDPMPTMTGSGPAPTGTGTGPAPTGTPPGPTSTAPGGTATVPDCSMVDSLDPIDTQGPSVPSEDSLEANFNVDLNRCTVRQEVLECGEDVNEEHLFEESVMGTSRHVVSNAIPNHEVGEFPVPMQNPHQILPQNLIFDVPLTPSGTGEALQVVFGIALSGVVFEPQTAEYFNDGEWLYEALRFASASDYDAADESSHPGALGLDCNFAHVQSAGKYHYHGVPTAMLPDEPALTLLGWAADGYPIFGVWGPTATDDATSPVRVMLPSYRIIGDGAEPRPEGAPPGNYDGTFVQDWEYVEGLGDLDECNGRTAEVVVEGELTTTYHYLITHAFPYIPRCFSAAPDDSFDPKMAR